MKTNRIAALAAAFAALGLTACERETAPAPAPSATAAEIAVTGAVLNLPAVRGNPGAVYFTVTNPTAEPAVLTGVSVTGAERTEMHETVDGRMDMIERVIVPSGGHVAFAPGGRHAMVFGLPEGLAVGDKAAVSLSFERGQTVAAEAAVQAPGTAARHEGSAH